MGGKTSSIGARIGLQLRVRLNAIASQHGPSDALMLEDALSALADYVEAAKGYHRPMKMVLDEEAAAVLRQQVAEDMANAEPDRVDETAKAALAKLPLATYPERKRARKADASGGGKRGGRAGKA